MNPQLIQQTLTVARDAALVAGALIKKSAGHLSSRQIQKKSANNFVTSIDRASERLILKAVRKNFPDHAILAEESGASPGRLPAGRQEITWMIDPIDGTSNFIHGFPLFSISIGVVYRERVVAGVVYDPSNDELFSASDKKGAFLNKKRIHVSRTPKLANALMVTGIPFRGFSRFEPYMQSFKKISLASAGMRRGGSAALDLAHVACGRLDGYWEMSLQPWDIAAGSILVREAGGTVTDLWSKDTYLKTGDILATNKRIHVEVNGLTKKIPAKSSRAGGAEKMPRFHGAGSR